MDAFKVQMIGQRILKGTALTVAIMISVKVVLENTPDAALERLINAKSKQVDSVRHKSHLHKNNTVVKKSGRPKKELDLILQTVLTERGKILFNTSLDSFKVYVYQLPQRFNQGLLQGAEENKFNAMCFDLDKNDGKGETMFETEEFIASNTHQFSSEVNFHQTLLRKKYLLTEDPRQADLFYVPFYAGLSCFVGQRDDRIQAERLEDLWTYIKTNYTYFTDGKPHVMALAKVEQEMSYRGCSILRQKHPANVKFLLVEQTVGRIRSSFHRAGKEDEVIVIPYPSYIHYKHPEAGLLHIEATLTNRTFKALMIGSHKNSDLRRQLGKQLKSCSRCHYESISSSECAAKKKKLPAVAADLMSRSTFCLQPPGDTPTRKSYIDGLLLGCIPVVFRNDVKYPYSDYIDYSKFAVYIPGDDVASGKVNVIHELDKVSINEIHDKQLRIAVIARYFQYGVYTIGEDLVKAVLRNSLDRFKLILN